MSCLPSRMLTDSITIKVPSAVTDTQEPTTYGTTITVTKVHVQRNSGYNNNATAFEATKKATVWYDCKLSKPTGIDFMALQEKAEESGATVEITHEGTPYKISRVIECKDGFNKLHHFEIEVI